MSSDRLGLVEAVSFALGGIIGGGIFAVLGIVVEVGGATAWMAYLLAGVVVMATGYSYVTLNALSDRNGGSVTFVEEFLGRPALAGTIGWTLVVGYVGTMAMYGYAFGAYFGALFGVETLPVVGLPARPVLSALVVAAFVGLNLVGVRESGLVEDLLVAVKLLVVVGFGVLGIRYGLATGALEYGVGELLARPAGPVLAAGVAFVSFEGWQLLLYDQERIEDPVETVRTAVYVSIPVSTLAYVVVAFVTVALVSREQVVAHPDLALALAAERFMGRAGYVLVGVAAVASTASAINATLFSTALFAKGLAADGLIPDAVAGVRERGVPARALVVVGGLTVAFTVYGSLAAITEFASLSFIVVFALVDYVALTQRHREEVSTLVPLVGLVGTLAFLPIFGWHLYAEQFDVFALVVVIAVVVVAAELLYFERRLVREGIRNVERRI